MAAARKPAAPKAPEVVEETPVEAPVEEAVAEEVTPDPEPVEEPVEAPEDDDLPEGEAVEPEPEPSVPKPPKHSLLALRLRRRITQGDHGPVVSQVQAALVAQGFDLKVTGAFGIQTARAVRQFQAGHGIRPTGEVNRQTWEAIMGVEVSDSDVIPTEAPEPVEVEEPEQETVEDEVTEVEDESHGDE
jgi:hypothetical protein